MNELGSGFGSRFDFSFHLFLWFLFFFKKKKPHLIHRMTTYFSIDDAFPT